MLSHPSRLSSSGSCGALELDRPWPEALTRSLHCITARAFAALLISMFVFHQHSDAYFLHAFATNHTRDEGHNQGVERRRRVALGHARRRRVRHLSKSVRQHLLKVQVSWRRVPSV